MLALSLEKLRQARYKDFDVQIYLDHTTEDRLAEVEYVRDEYFPEADIFHARNHVLAPSGCWNILNALKSGWQTGAELIFLVEEDCLVYSDFFDWHLKKQAEDDYFATCGRLIPVHSSDYYTNPGACFRQDKLRLVIPHINDYFFANRREYMDRSFGLMDEASDLDDGLIRRVIRQHHGRVGYPPVAKIAHQGFHYYDKFAEYQVSGLIQDRISQVRKILAGVNPAGRYTKDFEPFLDWEMT